MSDHITSAEGTPAHGNEGQGNDCYIRMSKDRSNSKLWKYDLPEYTQLENREWQKQTELTNLNLKNIIIFFSIITKINTVM